MSQASDRIASDFEDIARAIRHGDQCTDRFRRASRDIFIAREEKQNEPTISAPTQKERIEENRGNTPRTWNGITLDPNQEWVYLDEGGPPIGLYTHGD